MNRWIVKYAYCGSRYFDSPLYNAHDYQRFGSYDEARAWADGTHDDIPGYRLLLVYQEPEIRLKNTAMTAAERRKATDRSTDACILAGASRFR